MQDHDHHDENVGASLARIEERLNSLERGQTTMTQALLNQFVTHTEFAPVKALVYSLVGVIMLSFIVALLALVLKK